MCFEIRDSREGARISKTNMDDWEAEDFDPDKGLAGAGATDKWEGEDEDDQVKDSWDISDEEENKEEGAQTQAAQVKKKKPLKDRIAEREAKKKQELEEKRRKQEEENKKLSPEEAAAEKLRLQKIQEDSDFELTRDAFGISNTELTGDTIDAMNPSSREDFEKFGQVLKEKIIKYEKSAHYTSFLDNLIRELTVGLESDEVKKIGSTLNAVANEKAKAEKGTKGKKKSKKASVNAGKGGGGTLFDEYNDQGYYNEFDDFM